MTETEEEAEVAVERISLAVSSSPPGSPERPAAPTRSSVRVPIKSMVRVMRVMRVCLIQSGHHWTILDTGLHYHHMFTY